jgi:hypothetical protein
MALMDDQQPVEDLAAKGTNLTTGISVPFLGGPSKSKPSRLVAGSAEWILEMPVDDQGNPVFPLGRYGAVFFDDCAATAGEQFRTLAGAGQVTMVTAEDLPISTSTVIGDSTFRVDWSSGEALRITGPKAGTSARPCST